MIYESEQIVIRRKSCLSLDSHILCGVLLLIITGYKIFFFVLNLLLNGDNASQHSEAHFKLDYANHI